MINHLVPFSHAESDHTAGSGARSFFALSDGIDQYQAWNSGEIAAVLYSFKRSCFFKLEIGIVQRRYFIWHCTRIVCDATTTSSHIEYNKFWITIIVLKQNVRGLSLSYRIVFIFNQLTRFPFLSVVLFLRILAASVFKSKKSLYFSSHTLYGEVQNVPNSNTYPLYKDKNNIILKLPTCVTVACRIKNTNIVHSRV